MANIIDFMEKLGSSVDARQLSEADFISLLQEQGVVISDDVSLVTAVELALKARSNVVCGVFPAEEPGKEQPDENDDDEKKEPEIRQVVNS